MTRLSPTYSAEESRLAALHALDLLDTAPEREFDAITRLAATATGSDTAFIALIDSTRMWVKASVGCIPGVVPRTESLCDTIIRTDAPLIVDDLAADPRFHGHWVLAAGSRSYAGMPIRTTGPDGARHPVGTLCVLHGSPHALDGRERAALEDLAVIIEALIVTRRAARVAISHATALERQQRLFGQAERMARIGWWRLNVDSEEVEWSDGVYRIHELDPGTAPALATALDYYPPKDRAAVSQALATSIETGQPFDVETDFISAKGNKRRVRSMGEVEWAVDRPAAVIGVFRDVTEEHRLSVALRRSAETDPLTGMPNRSAFTRTLDRAIGRARDDGTPLALMLVDLDGFKRINDTFGHLAGDEVLKAVAARLHASWLKGTCAARLGGDEFGVIIEDAGLLADASGLAARLENELAVSTEFDEWVLESGASVGLARFEPARFATQQAFIHAADEELYAAKRRRVGERRAA